MDFSNEIFKKEIKLVTLSLQTGFDKKEIVEYLRPIVLPVGKTFLNEHIKKQEWVLSKKEKEIALDTIWYYLDFALNKYNKKSIKMLSGELESYLFSEYFIWFVKQAILEHLQARYK